MESYLVTHTKSQDILPLVRRRSQEREGRPSQDIQEFWPGEAIAGYTPSTLVDIRLFATCSQVPPTCIPLYSVIDIPKLSLPFHMSTD